MPQGGQKGAPGKTGPLGLHRGHLPPGPLQPRAELWLSSRLNELVFREGLLCVETVSMYRTLPLNSSHTMAHSYLLHTAPSDTKKTAYVSQRSVFEELELEYFFIKVSLHTQTAACEPTHSSAGRGRGLSTCWAHSRDTGGHSLGS